LCIIGISANRTGGTARIQAEATAFHRFRAVSPAITLKSRYCAQVRYTGKKTETIASIGGNMTAIIYNFDRWAEDDPVDETERLLSALERYTTAQLLELLYVGEEPGFFELVRGLFGLSDDSRLILQKFLSEIPPQTTVTIDADGRCVLTPGTFEEAKPVKGIA
jgi:hypothetical protein